jgi:hypothetical protein
MTAAMVKAADAGSPEQSVDDIDIPRIRQGYIEESKSVGTVPPPMSLDGAVKAGIAKLQGGHPTVLLDKMGERLAFERTGTRLYDALIVKYLAASAADSSILPPPAATGTAESASEALVRIRDEELAHFYLVREAMESLGGDPTAQTPSADVAAVASMGLIQVINDPRTTLAHCLTALQTAELTDNAGWELLITLAGEAGQDELASQFERALEEERNHLRVVNGWLQALMSSPTTSAAV